VCEEFEVSKCGKIASSSREKRQPDGSLRQTSGRRATTADAPAAVATVASTTATTVKRPILDAFHEIALQIQYINGFTEGTLGRFPGGSLCAESAPPASCRNTCETRTVCRIKFLTSGHAPTVCLNYSQLVKLRDTVEGAKTRSRP
jgi:hypothetical protein